MELLSLMVVSEQHLVSAWLGMKQGKEQPRKSRSKKDLLRFRVVGEKTALVAFALAF